MKKRLALACLVSVLSMAAAYVAMKEPRPDTAYEAAKEELLFKRRNQAMQASKAYPGMLSIAVTSNVAPPIQAGIPFTLTATVYSPNSYNAAHLDWHLPVGVRIVSGQKNQPISITGGQSATYQITLSAPDTSNYQIHAEVWKQVGPDKLGSVTQFNTNPSLLPAVPGAANGNGHGNGNGHPPKITL